LAGIMRHWIIDYHHVFMLRLLSAAVLFGVVLPAVWLLAGLIAKAARAIATLLAERPRSWRAHSAVER
jgi:hypothetical protein